MANSCYGFHRRECESDAKHCEWLETPLVHGCVHNLAQTEDMMRNLCGTPDEQEFVKAMMTDLAKYGIRMKSGNQDCRQLVTALISHSLLREHGLDEQSVAQFVETWKSRILPKMIARRIGYRNSLEELYSDIDSFLERLQHSANYPLNPADLLKIGLEGKNEMFGSGLNGARMLKILAAGTLLTLLFLATRSSPTDAPVVDPVTTFEPEPELQPFMVDESDSGYGVGTKLIGLGALGLLGKKGIGHLRSKEIPIKRYPDETEVERTARREKVKTSTTAFKGVGRYPVIVTASNAFERPIRLMAQAGQSILTLLTEKNVKQLLKGNEIDRNQLMVQIEDDLGNVLNEFDPLQKPFNIPELDQAEDGIIYLNIVPKKSLFRRIIT